jgi:hypothetical protein
MTSTPKAAKENPLITLIANVVLPVFILNKFSSKAAIPALIVALSLPLGYGLWSYYRTRKVNFISVLGLVNIVVTGSFVLLHLEGMWFTLKEAAFPFLIGCFVLASSYSSDPFLKMMLFETGALNTEDIEAHLNGTGQQGEFDQLLQRSTLFFSFTFFFSSILNFILAYKIFEEIPLELPQSQRAEILNHQIASMTWQGHAIIFVPSIILFFIILYYFFRKLSKLTGMPFDKLVKN